MIMRPFHTIFFLFLALLAGALCLLRRFARSHGKRARKALLVTICLCNLVFYFLYKFLLSRDAQFLAVSGLERFSWFSELPLQLCNINLFLIPLGVLTEKRPILGFSFFVAPLGALMAMCCPEPPFAGYSLFLPRMLGFYGTHGLLLVCGLGLAVMGFYRPNGRDFPGILAAYGVLTVAAHGVNALLRATGLCPHANYFFTYGADIAVLQWFWRMLPRPLLYELPAPFILLTYMSAVTGGFSLADKLRARRPETRGEEEELPA